MIQRIQSLYLLLAGVAMVLLMALKIETHEGSEGSIDLYYWGSVGIDSIPQGNWALMFLAPLALVIFILTIFQYKNRQLQMKLCRLSYLILAGVVVGIYLYGSAMNEAYFSGEVNVSRGVGAFMPIIALFGNFMALRSINKDEKLIRSVDRLR